MQESMASKIVKVNPAFQIYRTGRRIGFGAHGHVYQGFDRLNGRIVALKFVQNNKAETWRKQINALEKFNHPNIVKYYGFMPQKYQNSQRTQTVCIVTEYVRGETLHRFITSNAKLGEKGLSEPTVVHIFGQLLEGFNHIHSQGFVHRDIKPENILIDENMNPKIIDLGQSKQRSLIKTKGLGTPLYSPPEASYDKNPKDFRTDVWSIGLVLYEMITGRCYFEEWKECEDEDKFRRHLESHKIKIRYPHNFHPFWKQITKKMLQKNHNLRIHLHEVIFQFKSKLPELEAKLNLKKDVVPPVRTLGMSAQSSNLNPLTQSQNQFEFSRAKKYLRFFKDKHRLLVILNDLFSKYKYPFVSNSHKLLLVFLSLSIYVTAIEQLLKRLEKDKITISENEKFDATLYESPYRQAMVEYLSAYREYYEKEARYTKYTILEKIVPKFSFPETKSLSELDSLASLSTDPVAPSEVLDQHSRVRKLLEDFKRGVNYPKSLYLRSFREVVFSEDFYQPTEHIRGFYYEQDMLIYYLMLVIANLDDMLTWGHDYLGDELLKLQEQFSSLRRDEHEVAELLLKIEKLNDFGAKE